MIKTQRQLRQTLLALSRMLLLPREEVRGRTGDWFQHRRAQATIATQLKEDRP